MFGFVAGGSPHPTRWGDGSDGEATWSGTTTQSGVKQFTKLTISDSALVKVGTSGVMQNGLVIFANREIIIGNSAEINAQPNSDTYLNSTSWQTSGSDTTLAAFNGGGAGGGGGSNSSSLPGFVGDEGNDPVIYKSTGLGSSFDTNEVINALGSQAVGGNGGGNRTGYPGGDGYTVSSSIIKDNFSFFTSTDDGYDGFPVVKGGDGGQGGTAGNSTGVIGGEGGTGGGMILLISPKITFGSNVILNAYGATLGEGGSHDPALTYQQIRSAWTDDEYYSSLRGSYQHKGMNGAGQGDQGSGGGGGGGGGLVAVVYANKSGSYTSDVLGGVGGAGKTNDGNQGGPGGHGGDGVALDGQRGYLAGSITWS